MNSLPKKILTYLITAKYSSRYDRRQGDDQAGTTIADKRKRIANLREQVDHDRHVQHGFDHDPDRDTTG